MNHPKAFVFFTVCLIVCAGRLTPATIQGQEIPAEFLRDLPTATSDIPAEVQLILQQIEEMDDLTKRVTWLESLFRGGPIPSTSLEPRVQNIVQRTIQELSPFSCISFGAVVAHFPTLHDELLERASIPDSARLQLVRNIKSFELAKEVYLKIQTPGTRLAALRHLVPRAPDFDERILLFKELLSNSPDPSSEFFNSFSWIQQDLASSPIFFCDLIDHYCPAKDSARHYRYFAYVVSSIDKDSAQNYINAAWRRLPEMEAPAEDALVLLTQEDQTGDRNEWLSRFDRYILPELQEGKFRYKALVEIGRFDIELMIDRLKLIGGFPNSQFPSLMDRTFHFNPALVLDWLESGYLLALDISPDLQARYAIEMKEARDLCVFEIAEYLSILEPAEFEPHFKRLCDCALEIDDPALRLKTIAYLVKNAKQLEINIPNSVVSTGRAMMNESYRFEETSLERYPDRALHSLATSDQKRELINLQREQFCASEYPIGRSEIEVLLYSILHSELPDDEQLQYIQTIIEMPDEECLIDYRVQLIVLISDVDPAGAIRALWKLLPEDRGRLGKPSGNIGYTPPPSDASDAISWLLHGKWTLSSYGKFHREDRELKIMQALWEFLPLAPPGDREGIRIALCEYMLQQQQLNIAMGLILQIDNPIDQTELRLQWVSRMRAME